MVLTLSARKCASPGSVANNIIKHHFSLTLQPIANLHANQVAVLHDPAPGQIYSWANLWTLVIEELSVCAKRRYSRVSTGEDWVMSMLPCSCIPHLGSCNWDQTHLESKAQTKCSGIQSKKYLAAASSLITGYIVSWYIIWCHTMSVQFIM